MLILYDIFYILVAICYLPLFLIRKKYHRGFLMRLGIFPQSVIDKLRNKKVIWLHTVSVGETQAAGPLVKELKKEFPEHCLVISTVTQTGNKIAQGLVDAQDTVIYSPLDIGVITKRAVDLINPEVFIIAETEIWPNLIISLAKKDKPLILVNGRISRRSFRGYKIIRPFLRKILHKFNIFCMQTEEDAQRIIELGANKDKVKVTGNMKFDIQTQELGLKTPDLGLSQDERLFIAGSTHRGEEEIILQVYEELIKNYPNLRLLIAPRHIERTEEIKKLVSKFRFERPVLILDTIGQLKDLYALAEFVFIGGSLIPHGGQNPIEPAVFSKPILFGPYMSNFFAVSQTLLGKCAAIMIKDAQQLKDSCIRLLNDCELRKELGSRAKEAIEEGIGATTKNTNLIKGLISKGVA